jgi:hypothetical protein
VEGVDQRTHANSASPPGCRAGNFTGSYKKKGTLLRARPGETKLISCDGEIWVPWNSEPWVQPQLWTCMEQWSLH